MSENEEKEYVEIVDNRYAVVFKVDKPFIVVQAYDKNVGDGVISYLHYLKDPTPILEDPETRKLLAESIVKVFKFFRKYHPLIGNVVQVQFDITPEELEKRIRQLLKQGETQ
jgi:hypothetical protein